MIKEILKNVRVAVRLNRLVKCSSMKRQYERLCRAYGTPSVLRDYSQMSILASALWSARAGSVEPRKRTRVLFVGTDPQQDYSGTVQALRACSELTVFEHEPGQHGQRWPRTRADFETVRFWNGDVLRRYIRTGEYDVIVGQMWGLSMDWKALAEARSRGIAVVNIAMDDRHSFSGRRFRDGTESGTRALAPYLSLACTDAPECVAWYEAERCRAMFLPEASDPDIFASTSGDKMVDVSFVGARYGVREDLVAQLERAGIRVTAYGRGWSGGVLDTEEVPRLFAQSKIVLGCGTIGHCDDFVGLKLRDFDAPMTGSLYMTHRNPDLEPLLSSPHEIVTFGNQRELVEKVQYYLSHDAERETIASAGRQRCVSEHTWQERVLTLLNTLELSA